jgi:hypothetical protein
LKKEGDGEEQLDRANNQKQQTGSLRHVNLRKASGRGETDYVRRTFGVIDRRCSSSVRRAPQEHRPADQSNERIIIRVYRSMFKPKISGALGAGVAYLTTITGVDEGGTIRLESDRGTVAPGKTEGP